MKIKSSFYPSQNPRILIYPVPFKAGLLSYHLKSNVYLQTCRLAFNPVIGIIGSSYLILTDSQFGVSLSSRIWQLLKTHFFLENMPVFKKKKKANLFNPLPNYVQIYFCYVMPIFLYPKYIALSAFRGIKIHFHYMYRSNSNIMGKEFYHPQ